MLFSLTRTSTFTPQTLGSIPYLRTMSDSKSVQSESSKRARGLNSEPCQRGFDTSDVGSIVPSDASHLASVSCSSSISDKFLETSENAPGAEEVSERCDEASEFTNNQCTDVNTSNLDEVEEVQSIPGGRSIAHHTLNNHLCQFVSIGVSLCLLISKLVVI